jgi:hypothetical protein
MTKSSSARRHDVEDRDDVSMLDARREPGLVDEHRDELGVLRELPVEALDRDRPREPRRAARATVVNGSHPPDGDFAEDDVAADLDRLFAHSESIPKGARSRAVDRVRYMRDKPLGRGTCREQTEAGARGFAGDAERVSGFSAERRGTPRPG